MAQIMNMSSVLVRSSSFCSGDLDQLLLTSPAQPPSFRRDHRVRHRVPSLTRRSSESPRPALASLVLGACDSLEMRAFDARSTATQMVHLETLRHWSVRHEVRAGLAVVRVAVAVEPAGGEQTAEDGIADGGHGTRPAGPSSNLHECASTTSCSASIALPGRLDRNAGMTNSTTDRHSVHGTNRRSPSLDARTPGKCSAAYLAIAP